MLRRGRSFALLTSVALTVLVTVTVPATPAEAGAVDAHDTFERLKSLSGTWHGEWQAAGAAEQEESGAEQADKTVVHELQVSAAGTVVMETMNPGSDHEMINMYHLDGDELVLTHYCAAGNQPTMRLDRERSTADHLVFEFTGGTNLDPAVDGHIHSAEITLVDDDRLESSWTGWAEGQEAATMTFHLSRQ